MKTIKPSAHQLFVKPDEKETKTASGLYMTEASAEKPSTAVVINVGSEVQGFEPDDKVVYKSYASTEIKLNGDEYMLLADEDVLGVIVDTGE